MNCVHCNDLLDSQQIDIYATTRSHSNTILADYMKNVLNCEVNKHSNYICKVCYGIFNELDLAQMQCTLLSDRIFERWIFIECNNATKNICIQTNDVEPKELLNDIEITNSTDGTYKSFTNNTRSIKKPHDCKHCKKKFVSKTGLALHLQRKHGNQTVDNLSIKHIKSEIDDYCLDSPVVETLEPLVIDESSCSSNKSKIEGQISILNPSIYSDLIKTEVLEPLESQPNVENRLNTAKGKTKNKKPIIKSNLNYEEDLKPLVTQLHVETNLNNKSAKSNTKKPNIKYEETKPSLNDCPTSKIKNKKPTIKDEDLNADVAESLNDECSSNSSNDDSDKSKTKKKKPVRPLKPLKYSCPQCSKMWRTTSELRTHVETHSAARPYICEICGQAYKHKSALDIHVGMHNGIHPFKCEFCNKTFTQKGALHRHMPIHTGEAPFQCDLCGKRFLHHTSFNMHTLAHTGEKSYKCTLCGLALLSGSHLKRHMRVHTGERPYACDHCGKRFAERYNLAAHQRLHEVSPSDLAKRSHHCQVCGATFDRRPKLEEHLATNHNKISEKDQTRNWIGHFIANT